MFYPALIIKIGSTTTSAFSSLVAPFQNTIMCQTPTLIDNCAMNQLEKYLLIILYFNKINMLVTFIKKLNKTIARVIFTGEKSSGRTLPTSTKLY